MRSHFCDFTPDFFLMFERDDSRLALFNGGTQSASVRHLRATSLSEAMRYSTVNKLPKAAFVAASLVFAGAVFAVAGQAGATVNNALPSVTSIHPQQASSPTPSPMPT
jgi:hypothetical protein